MKHSIIICDIHGCNNRKAENDTSEQWMLIDTRSGTAETLRQYHVCPTHSKKIGELFDYSHIDIILRDAPDEKVQTAQNP